MAGDNHESSRGMDIAEWRKKIDELDRKLVELLSERAHCAHEIGKLKRNSAMPIYEPDREKIIYENIARHNPGPLSERQLRQVYERLIDVMRQIQRDEMSPAADAEKKPTELEPSD
jgi:chorismate mutase-like protein